MADTATYAPVMKTTYPKPGAKNLAGRRKAKRRQKKNYLAGIKK